LSISCDRGRSALTAGAVDQVPPARALGAGGRRRAVGAAARARQAGAVAREVAAERALRAGDIGVGGALGAVGDRAACTASEQGRDRWVMKGSCEQPAGGCGSTPSRRAASALLSDRTPHRTQRAMWRPGATRQESAVDSAFHPKPTHPPVLPTLARPIGEVEAACTLRTVVGRGRAALVAVWSVAHCVGGGGKEDSVAPGFAKHWLSFVQGTR
jgi:hypothetical protein